MYRLATVFLTLTLAIVVLATASLNNVAVAQKEPIKGKLPLYWKGLGLSDEQKQKVFKIRDDYGTKIKSLNDQLKKLRDEEQKELSLVLTPQQRQALRDIIAKKVGGGATETPEPKEKTKVQKKTTDK
jgi:Spy/CpxP family protein refolding chaperone